MQIAQGKQHGRERRRNDGEDNLEYIAHEIQCRHLQAARSDAVDNLPPE
ncbi:hypothetical protein PPOP_3197 [Paenibacillus popilliae ATCC 14706]|uniref:Uncharacterized protein n=1 Tax=Paenibacillus popilliae ATCC 14706 TaxID=1212764 RepID=M9LCH2_PAEPP|nr:hypothetical protein PPOP_3197 [Paenibacillus popilliae ATCC 14706]